MAGFNFEPDMILGGFVPCGSSREKNSSNVPHYAVQIRA
jgi:hypothetical protein